MKILEKLNNQLFSYLIKRSEEENLIEIDELKMVADGS